jgi:hypothetical protein
MSGKSEKPRQDMKHTREQGNLGQKEAKQDQRSETKMAHMGELSKAAEQGKQKS